MHHDLGRTNGGGLYRDRDSGASERYFNVLLGFALTDFFFPYGSPCAHPQGSYCAFIDRGGHPTFQHGFTVI